MKRYVLLCCWVFLATALAGCEQISAWLRSDPAPEKSDKSATRESFLQAQPFKRAVDAIFVRLEQPIRVLSLSATPDAVVAQVQNSTDRAAVDEYRYNDNGLSGPTRVTLLGKGKLKDNLFLLRAVNLGQTGDLLAHVQGEYPLPIKRLVLKRNLPQSMDIYFRVHLADGDGELIVALDKKGRLLGPIQPQFPVGHAKGGSSRE